MFISHPAVLSNTALFVKPIRVCVWPRHMRTTVLALKALSPARLPHIWRTGRNCWVIRGILGSSYLIALTRRAARALAAEAPHGSLGG
jgi:hypothetical protein